MVAGFPNLFIITGPGSPSVLSNMLVSIEQHVDWISGCIALPSREWLGRESRPPSMREDDWVAHVNDVGEADDLPAANSWYLGANVPGKPRVFMPFSAGWGLPRALQRDRGEGLRRLPAGRAAAQAAAAASSADPGAPAGA